MIEIKLAEVEDFDFFYEMKCEKSNMYWTGSMEMPLRDNICKFFHTCINEQEKELKRKIFIIKNGNTSVGYLYLIPDNKEVFDLAVAISEKHRGHGYSSKAIVLGLEEAKRLGYKRLIGHIREDNKASFNAYEKCGGEFTDKYIIKDVPCAENGEIVLKKIKMYEVIINI